MFTPTSTFPICENSLLGAFMWMDAADFRFARFTLGATSVGTLYQSTEC